MNMWKWLFKKEKKKESKSYIPPRMIKDFMYINSMCHTYRHLNVVLALGKKYKLLHDNKNRATKKTWYNKDNELYCLEWYE